MATRAMATYMSAMGELRYEPLRRRLRGFEDDRVLVDTERAMLVWEPKRIVPQYAVPEADVAEDVLEPESSSDHDGDDSTWEHPDAGPVLPPGRFRLHSTPGDELRLRLRGGDRPGGAYRLDDEDLAGYVIVEFDALDRWLEEEDEVAAHPRDPFKRIDVQRSSRNVRIEHGGQLLAESRRPSLLFETSLPARYYLPADDVRLDELTPSDTVTWCAYKGRATHWSIDTDDGPLDVAWTYRDPRNDAVPVRNLVGFYHERLDVTVDGERGDRPSTPWS